MTLEIKKGELEQIFLKEYDMLVNAHFQTSQRIISFFQYTLAILAAPLTLFINLKNYEIIGCVFVFVGIIGVIILCYLTQLRAEALMYARSLNRIRSNFYSKSLPKEYGPFEIDRNKILLTQDKKPSFSDLSQFGFIAIALGIINGLYFSSGVVLFLPIFCENFRSIEYKAIVFGSIFFIYIVIEIIVYFYLAYLNEYGYTYYRRIIGIDIDGVLNDHEEQFVRIFNSIHEKQIVKKDITTLPVSKSGKITREEEHAVFRTIEYWQRMPKIDSVDSILEKELRNNLGYKLYLFTSRDWDNFKNLKREKCEFDIERHTVEWLKNIGLKKFKVFFEKGNIYKKQSRFAYEFDNRYAISRIKKIRYFVEDSLVNAEKLSHICEYVFLIDHQYNQKDRYIRDLPYNVIRVKNWFEIIEWIKRLS